MSQGIIFIDSGATPGNATVFEGSLLQTDKVGSQVHLKNGGSLTLGKESKSTLFSDHIDLLAGTAAITDISANANGYKISTDKAGSAEVSLHGKVTEIAALTGSVHVFNAKGLNVANLAPGKELELQPQDAGAASPTQDDDKNKKKKAAAAAAAGGAAAAGIGGVSTAAIVVTGIVGAAALGVGIGVATTGGTTSPGGGM